MNKERINPDFGEAVKEDKEKFYQLVLHNDEHNTFEHVIESLMAVCKHDEIQAEQCAHITHYKGKCDIKKGEFDTLHSMKQKLTEVCGLSVTIDEV